ncbi:hypothetical protein FRC16_004464 [Serendipita sp. 398]|nr:hypothetical protein FRC16_004464 [Serendipita sp. 398]
MQTRRLHVSGLTPAISEADLRARFSVFGNVKTVDGVGKLDGLDQPRRFAYVSLEATPDKHSKCLNILSGATWKGAKLRIGEARPDFTPRYTSKRYAAWRLEGNESSSSVSTEETAHHEDNAARPVRLKELFSIANQEPTSILAGLDLELELDNSLEFDVMPRSMQETAPANGTELHANARKQNTLHRQRRELESFQFSTDLPYFFPLESGEVSRGAVKDTFSIAQTQGWRSVFLNPPSSDEVRKQWEAEKVALTRDWKQRYREACKRERRGGGHVDGIETIA